MLLVILVQRQSFFGDKHKDSSKGGLVSISNEVPTVTSNQSLRPYNAQVKDGHRDKVDFVHPIKIVSENHFKR